MPATRVESKTDQWTVLTIPSGGKVVRHLDEGTWGGEVWLTTLAAAPASPFSAAVLLVFPVSEKEDGHWGADHDDDGVSGGFAVSSLRQPLRWSLRIAVAGTSRQAILKLQHPFPGRKLLPGASQITTAIQLKGRKPAGSGSLANFTNTATLSTPNGGFTYVMKWTLTSTEASEWQAAGVAQLELSTGTNQAFDTWTTFAETQPGAEKAVITLQKGEPVKLDPPATSGDSWYHRASFEACHLAIE